MPSPAAPSTTVEPQRRLGVVDIAAVVIGGIIGVGIFFTPASLARTLPSPGWMLGVWALGGVIALMGAMVLAELGGRIPQAGGVYVFLREGFGRAGPLLAFLYGWINLLVLQPGALAIIGLVLADYLARLTGDMSEPVRLGVAAAAIAGFSITNIAGLRMGAGIQRLVTGLKVLAVAVLVAIGVGWGAASWAPAPSESAAQGGWMALLVTGLIPVLFSYGGWQHGTYVAGVARDPKRNVPRGIVGGVVIVVIAYLTVNLAYVGLLGQDGMAASQTLASDAVGVVLGPVAESVVALAIVLSAAGILNTISLAFPYVTYAMARDGLFIEAAGRLHPRFQTPAWAVGIQGVWATAVVVLAGGRIETLLDGLAFGEWAFFAAVAFAHLRLQKSLGPHEGFRAPRWVSVVFALVASGVAVGALAYRPRESLLGVVVLVMGGLVYAWRARRAS